MDGTAKGTPRYMSPEQASGKAIDFRTDLWSLGAVLYEMIAGRPAFEGDTQIAVIHSILHNEPRPLDAPPEVRRVIEKALEKDPRKRYESARKMEEDLAACLAAASRESSAAHARWPIGKWTRARVAAMALTLAVLGAAGAWFYYRYAKIRWAKDHAMPEIARLAGQGKYVAALLLAQEAKQYIPKDAGLAREWDEISREVSIDTTPSGAEVALKEYSTPDAEWVSVGRSPMPKIRVPLGLLRWRVSKPGYSTIYEAWTSMHSGGRILFEMQNEGAIPNGMVQVPGGPIGFNVAFIGTVGGFNSAPYFIDTHEVTNRQFKQFVDARRLHPSRILEAAVH